MSELEEFLDKLDRQGIDRRIIGDTQTAHVMLNGHQFLSQRKVDGLEIDCRQTSDRVIATIRARRDVQLARPLHLCFGLLSEAGRQHIETHLVLEEGARLNTIAHCFFPNAQQVEHRMDATIEIGAGAVLTYNESHFHGPFGGVTVVPKAKVRVKEGGRYLSEFSLITGLVGQLDIDYQVDAGEDAVVELVARIFGHGEDRIKIREQVVLAGKGARGLIKTRVAVEHHAIAEIVGITEGNAERARGHVDCLEIVKDSAVASAWPLVKVSHPLAKVTHEAAIGSVDHHQLETLMAHGLSPEQAVDMIVSGLLGGNELGSDAEGGPQAYPLRRG